MRIFPYFSRCPCRQLSFLTVPGLKRARCRRRRLPQLSWPRRYALNAAPAGTSLIEFSVAAVPILLVGLGCIEIAQWFYIKQALSLALLQAARAGITQHASPQAIQDAFEQALRPLYPPTGQLSSEQRMQRAFLQRRQKTGSPPWRIEVLSPPPLAFDDFADKSLAIGQQTGRAAINNNYQAEQDQRFRAQGWTNGAGPKSGLSIYQANYLRLRLTYLHEPLLPGMPALIRLLGSDAAGYAGQAMAQGYLPLNQEIQLTMQSHPVDWPALANGQVIRQASGSIGAVRSLQPCHGLWCFNQGLTPGSVNGDVKIDSNLPDGSNPAGTVDSLGQLADQPADRPISPAPPDPLPGASPPTLDVAPDDPACGVSLCCIT
jgi:hypothetical protein